METFLFTAMEISGGRNEKSMVASSNSFHPHPITASPGPPYDVFLSFRGADTRNQFVSFLYEELRGRARIDVFLDSKKLRGSEEILQTLMEAIDNSSISIPIFSKDYASSKSCLMEVSKIFKCMKTKGQIVLPIFYDIEPSDVRNQRGTFEQSFRQHQKNGVELQDLKEWKQALKEVGNKKGYVVSGNQAEVVGQVASRVSELLRTREVFVTKDLAGIDERVQAVAEMLEVSSSDVRIVGICGMAGIGKTTLAKVVYNKFHQQFQASSFISNIRERSVGGDLCHLQRQLINDLLSRNIDSPNTFENHIKMIENKFRNIKVLIVLDDVECKRHIEAFAIHCNCFGPGSKVILTTRNPTSLNTAFDATWYDLMVLNKEQARKLFYWHAFRNDSPEGEFYHLSNDIVDNMGGIPSVIEFIGSYLSHYRNIDERRWEEVLQKLRNCEHEHLEESLRISYDFLNEKERQIYLDIACLFKEERKNVACYMWEDCIFYPREGIDKLLHLSLVKIGENGNLIMNNPVREFGKKLVVQESADPRRRSRLWSHEEALEILNAKEGTEYIKAMCLQFDNESRDCLMDEELGDGSSKCLTEENFKGLLELRFLRLDGAKISGDFQNLFPKLRWLDWKNWSEISKALKNLDLKNLVILNMSCSNVTKKWRGWDLIKTAEKMKVLILASCYHLEGAPCLPDHWKLAILNLEHCYQLRRISIPSCTIKTLVCLNIKGCRNINELPPGLSSMTALEELIIDGTAIREIIAGSKMKKLQKLSACGCKDLRRIDDTIGNLKSLLILALDDTAIMELPYSICTLKKLQTLSLRNCKIDELPSSIGDLTSLVKMDLSHTLVAELPPSIEHLKSLQVLLMEGTFLSQYPEAITKLGRLEKIDFSFCRSMTGGISNDISNLSFLTTLMLSATEISSLPTNISQLSKLQVLDFHKCKQLQDFSSLPSGLTFLRMGSNNMINVPNLSNMANLIELHIADNTDKHPELPIGGRIPELPVSFQWITNLSKLETLELHMSKLLELPENFSALAKLRKLVLSCLHLECLPSLPLGLTTLCLHYCKSLCKSLELQHLTYLSKLDLIHCAVEIVNLKSLSKLQVLQISDCPLKKIKGIKSLLGLRKLTLSSCQNFKDKI